MTAAAERTRETFVLVHGGFHGGWCWRRVAEPLRVAGHTVFTPTLTGLGERAHLLSPEIGLETMISDVLGVIAAEELTDVVLVGHSFGALPVLAAADRVPERINRLVILDGLVVEPGACGFDLFPPETVAQREEAARLFDGGTAFPPPPAASFGLTDPVDVLWLDRRLTPHPLRAYRDPLILRNPLGNSLPTTYVHCTAPVYPALADGLPAAVLTAGWEVRELATGHNLMVTDPDGTIAELLRAP
ncbi:alpha/beta fold hydrolase [Pseudonocardia ailaonensis]|uniref:Alpha/beta fold hydrolase n=1 Tax=Pseudonocardia ailaonensis TaxID=367279 RepID=A0ABN2N9C2_9PSEU